MTGRRIPDAGVTLVEVLVVLAIVGVMSGAAVIGLGALDRGARAETEALRLAERLRFAADEALVTGAPRALVWDAQGYRFLVWDAAAGAWRDEAAAALAPAHALAGGLSLATADPAADPVPLLIAPDLAQPATALRLQGVGQAWRVAFDGLGAAATPIGP